MALPALSTGAVRRLVTKTDNNEKFVMQCIGVKQLAVQGNNPVPERFRLALSDGEMWTSVMLATQLNHLVKDHMIENGSVVRLKDNMPQDVPSRRYPVIVILQLDVLGKDAQRGSPANVDTLNLAVPKNPGPGPDLGPQAGPGGGSGPNPNAGMGPGSGGYGPPAGKFLGPFLLADGGGYGGASGANHGASAQNGYHGGQQNGAPAYGAPASGPTGGGYAGGQGSAYGQPAGGPGYGNTGPNAATAGGFGGAGYGGGGYGNAPGGQYGAGPGRGGYGGGSGGDAYGQPAPMYSRAGGGPTARNEAPARIMPIKSLNAYQNRWTIKARVTQKSDLRRWNNARGEGKFFTCDLLDAQGGEIRCVAFNDQADKFENVIQMGAVLMISKASLKPRRGNYNQTRHDFEIHLENASQVDVCPEEAAEIPQIQYHFKKLEELETTPANNIVDVIGVVEHVEAWTTITRKDGTETQKRSLTIKDKTNRSIEVSFWGRFAQDPGNDLEQKVMQQQQHPVLTIKGARVGDFNGKSLSTVSSSIVTTDPDIPECDELRQWYGREGAQVKAASLSDSRMSGGRQDRRCTLQHIKDEQLGQGAPAYIQVSAWVTFIRNEAAKMYYPACTLNFNGRTCNKKLSDQGGQWWCERCNQPSHPEFRYILSLSVKDHTTEQWLTAFQESGADIMGLSADDLRNLEQSESEFSLAVQAATFKQLLFKLKIAEENYNDENRIKMSVVRVEPVDFVKEGRVMLDWIHKLQAGEQIMQPTAATSSGPGYKAGGGYGGGLGPQMGKGGGGYGGGGYGGGGMGANNNYQSHGGDHSSTYGYGGGGFGPGGF